MPDYTNKFNTQLDPVMEHMFQRWLVSQSMLMGRDLRNDSYDYDLRGYWKNQLLGPNATMQQIVGLGHGPDTYKKPNHPTFSDESIYSNAGMPGGIWGDNSFTPSVVNMQMHTPEWLQSYFQRVEPGTTLNLPKKRGK